jgi:ABC-type transport system involved in multi-copper enzyme maturation permease subunit
MAAHQIPVSGAELGASALYALGWTVVFAGVAAVLFSRRDFK